MQKEEYFSVAAAKAGMDEKTARKYRNLGKLPSEIKEPHDWRTRQDPFEEVWLEVKGKLELNPGLEAKTLFEDLQRRYPMRFQDGQLRTLQRKIKRWRALEGPPKEVYFPQRYKPGDRSQSDFTHMGELGITIAGEPFDHLLYHFVLPYSNWETGTVCFSESFESLSEGLQRALWELGGVPISHQTDRLSAAVHNGCQPEAFTRRYNALLNHYGLEGRRINAGKANENGDVEQRHHRFKRAVDQSLLLRGHRDFEDRASYEVFLKRLFEQLNLGRRQRFLEEQKVLQLLPMSRLDACKRLQLKVGPSSTIHVNHNTYSVNSRLIGEKIDVRLYADTLEIWYGQKKIETLPRLRGESGHYIQYRHIIDWLIRKPGAFENYRYRDALYPTSRFRIAYDALKKKHSDLKAGKEYLGILYLAARESELKVDEALSYLIDCGKELTADTIKAVMEEEESLLSMKEVGVSAVDLGAYDILLTQQEAA